MILKDLLSDKLDDIDNINIKTDVFNDFIIKEKEEIKRNHFYLFEFLKTSYFREVKSIANKSVRPKNFCNENLEFVFLGYTNKKYLIYEVFFECKNYVFHINEDLNGVFFYPVNSNEEPLYRIKFKDDFSDFYISYLLIEDSKILISSDHILIEINENKSIFKNIYQFEFFNYKMKVIKTSDYFINLFNGRAIFKMAFTQRHDNTPYKCKFYFYNKQYDLILNEYDYKEMIIDSHELGIQILNPIYCTTSDVELFELNYLS